MNDMSHTPMVVQKWRQNILFDFKGEFGRQINTDVVSEIMFDKSEQQNSESLRAWCSPSMCKSFSWCIFKTKVSQILSQPN